MTVSSHTCCIGTCRHVSASFTIASASINPNPYRWLTVIDPFNNKCFFNYFAFATCISLTLETCALDNTRKILTLHPKTILFIRQSIIFGSHFCMKSTENIKSHDALLRVGVQCLKDIPSLGIEKNTHNAFVGDTILDTSTLSLILYTCTHFIFLFLWLQVLI